MNKVRTRFAPSPTGFLHIGGLRTALFAFLFARHHGGQFILRIEDTDRNRLVPGAVKDIIDSLHWIGIWWDEGPDIGGPYSPYLQSQRQEIYKKWAHELVRKGQAYHCFCTPQRLSLLREKQKKEGKNQGYDRHCRDLPVHEVENLIKKGKPSVIRLKVPLTGKTTFHDRIRGTISTDNTILDDTVLLKTDGFPTYHLANVIDDRLMKITHVIRGDEWISSTPRHIILYQAFGWEPPVFAHVPVILAPGGGKLSKRHGATMVREFREKGYLPEAVLNFVTLLGWSLDDKTEFFELESLIKYFDLERVNKAPAVFSYEKLEWFNGVYIRKTSNEELYHHIIPFLIKSGLLEEKEEPVLREYIMSIVPLIRERMKYLSQAPELTWFFFDQKFQIMEKDALIPKGMGKEQASIVLKKAVEKIEALSSFGENKLEETLRNMIDELKIKSGNVFMTLRVAITGTKVSPGLFETIRVLGKERVIKRLKDAIKIVEEVK